MFNHKEPKTVICYRLTVEQVVSKDGYEWVSLKRSKIINEFLKVTIPSESFNPKFFFKCLWEMWHEQPKEVEEKQPKVPPLLNLIREGKEKEK